MYIQEVPETDLVSPNSTADPAIYILSGTTVTGRFGPIPVRTPGRFGPIPFRSGRFGLGRFGPILEVGRFGQISVGRFGPLYFI